jgi:maltokinase
VTGPLERALAACAPEDLLPARRVDEAGRIQGPLTLMGKATIGRDHRYLLVEDARGVRYGVPAVLEQGRLRRAVAGDGASEALIGLLASGAQGAAGLELTAVRATSVHGERSIDVDQTNDLVAVGGEAVVKWLLHPCAGDEPGPARLATLAAAGFDGTPQVWGFAHLVDGDRRSLIATVAAFVPQTQDGWEWAVNDVRSLAFGGLSRSAALEPVRAIAALVARMHLALSTAGSDRATAADAQRWLAAADGDLHEAELDPVTADRVKALLRPLGECIGTSLIDVHGDLHIGQILRSSATGSYFVIDFDGSPMQTPAERLRRQPAARDVAGMLASLDHVGRVVLHRTDGLDDAQERRVLDWIDSAQAVFLDSYRAMLSAHARADLLDDALLDALQVQQECREFAYARRYLPHWRYVPDAALPALLNRSERES